MTFWWNVLTTISDDRQTDRHPPQCLRDSGYPTLPPRAGVESQRHPHCTPRGCQVSRRTATGRQPECTGEMLRLVTRKSACTSNQAGMFIKKKKDLYHMRHYTLYLTRCFLRANFLKRPGIPSVRTLMSRCGTDWNDCEELVKYLSRTVTIPLTMINFRSSRDLQRTGRCFYAVSFYFKACDRVLSLTSKTSARVAGSASLQQQVLVSPPLLSKGGR